MLIFLSVRIPNNEIKLKNKNKKQKPKNKDTLKRRQAKRRLRQIAELQAKKQDQQMKNPTPQPTNE